ADAERVKTLEVIVQQPQRQLIARVPNLSYTDARREAQLAQQENGIEHLGRLVARPGSQQKIGDLILASDTRVEIEQIRRADGAEREADPFSGNAVREKAVAAVLRGDSVLQADGCDDCSEQLDLTAQRLVLRIA